MIKKTAATSKHVVFVLKDLGYFLSHRLDLAKYMVEQGVEVSLFTDLQSEQSFAGRDILANVHDLPFSSAFRAPWKLIFPTVVFFRFLLTRRSAIVFSITIPAVLLSGLVCQLLGVRQIILFAGLGNIFNGDTSFVRRILCGIIRQVTSKSRTTIIAQNSSIKNFLVNQRFASEVALIAGSGIDPSKFIPPRNKQTNSPPKILFLGRMLKEKGVIEFINAAKMVLKIGFEADFILAGRTDPLNPTSLTKEQISDELTDQEHIKWIGETKNSTDLLASIDIVCLPSYHEGLPRVLLEGALMGCCLIASDIPGCNDIVINEKTGLLVPPNSSDALCKGFIKLLEDPTMTEQLAANAREHVLKNFANAVVLPQYSAIIQKIESSWS